MTESAWHVWKWSITPACGVCWALWFSSINLFMVLELYDMFASVRFEICITLCNFKQWFAKIRHSKVQHGDVLNSVSCYQGISVNREYVMYHRSFTTDVQNTGFKDNTIIQYIDVKLCNKISNTPSHCMFWVKRFIYLHI